MCFLRVHPLNKGVFTYICSEEIYFRELHQDQFSTFFMCVCTFKNCPLRCYTLILCLIGLEGPDSAFPTSSQSTLQVARASREPGWGTRQKQERCEAWRLPAQYHSGLSLGGCLLLPAGAGVGGGGGREWAV